MLHFMLLMSVLGADDASEIRKAIDASPDKFQVYLSIDSETPMEAVSALRWTNNARGSEDGLTILYVHEGRPEAVAAVYPWEGSLNCGFDSLSRTKIVARDGAEIVWQPQEAGVKFQPIPGAPVPAKSKALRMRQMKSMAKDFGSTMLGWKSDDSDREALRRLPKPLYRYKTDGKEVLDGIVFAFVLGTDPESLVVLEAVKVSDEYQWQFCFVRRTSGALNGTHRGEVVWTAEKFPRNHDPNSVHYTVRRQPADYLQAND